MPFWQRIFIVLIVLQQVSQAQTILMFEDQTKNGFKLVVNNYLQNETDLPKLNLQNIPSGEPDLLIILKDSTIIRRKLPELETGIHKYVIYRDYKGKVRLRYRGIYNDLGQSAIMFDYSEHKEWSTVNPQDDQIALNDSSSQYQSWLKEEELLSSTKPIDSVQSSSVAIVDSTPVNHIALQETSSDSSAVIPVQPDVKEEIVAEIPNPTDSLVISDSPIASTLVINETNSKDSIKTLDSQAKPQEIAKPLANTNPYDEFKKKFDASDFEFDKLQMASAYNESQKVNLSEAIEILKGLKYDQSRLSFLASLYSKQEHLKGSVNELINCLDYDLSKQEAKNILK